MPIIALTAPAAEPLTLAQVRLHLREALPEDDAIIEGLIRTARELIEAETGLCLMPREIAEFHDEWPSTLLSAPVREVTEVRVSGADGASAIIDPAHWYLDAASRPARLVLRDGRNFPRPGIPANGICVKLKAGFADADHIPDALHQAMLMEIQALFAARNGEARAVSPEASRLIKPFKKVRL